jgi:SAM-dependent methyltransferase
MTKTADKNKLWDSEYASLLNKERLTGPKEFERNIWIKKLLSKKKKGKILEVGCGTGNVLKNFQEAKLLCGLEISKKAALMCSKNLSKINTASLALVGSAVSLPFKGKFDGLICSEVLEHIDNDVGALSEMRRLVADDGILVITVPFNKRAWAADDVFAGHKRRYSFKELKEKLSHASFKIIKYRYLGFPLGVPVRALFIRNIKRGKANRVFGGNRKQALIWKGARPFLYGFYLFNRLFSLLGMGQKLLVVAAPVEFNR